MSENFSERMLFDHIYLNSSFPFKNLIFIFGNKGRSSSTKALRKKNTYTSHIWENVFKK